MAQDLPQSAAPRALLAAIVDSSDDAIVSKSLEGIVTSWNRGAERVFGYTADEMIAQPITKVIPPELHGQEVDILARIARGEPIEHFEAVRVRKGGARIQISLSVSPVRNEDGMIVAAAKIARDITQEIRARGRAERLHRLSIELGALLSPPEVARLLVSAARTGVDAVGGRVAIKGEDGLEVMAAWGESEAEARDTALPPLEVGSDLPPERPAASARAAATGGQGHTRLALPLATAERVFGVFEIELAGGPDLDPGDDAFIGTLVRLGGQALERAALFEAERKAREDAESANQTKLDFLAAMSHELRTPLNAISGYTDLLVSGVHGDLSEEARDALRRIQHNQRHLLALINDLLSFARLEAGHLELNLERLRASVVLADLEALVGPQLRAKSLTYACQAPPDDLTFLADHERVRQILLNLLSNAIKFTPSGGRISVSATASPGRVILHVRDTGVGIDPGDREAIFDPFVQPNRTLSSHQGGTGLGLAISRDLARAMGGEIEVESVPGDGSVFHVAFPAAGA